MRVLVWGLTNNAAGTETVILNIASCLSDAIHFDFLTMEEVPNHQGELSSGQHVFVIPNRRTSYLAYKRAIRSFFDDHAPEYDAVWVNLNILSNIDVLRLAYEFGIPKRILHSHNSGNDGKLHQKVLCHLNERTFERYVTDRWSCSQMAGRFMFGDAEFTVVPNAIELDKYVFSGQARARVRRELGIGDRLVVGATGRLCEQKNYAFLLDVLADLLETRPDAMLVIAGDGELRRDLQARAKRLGVDENVVFLGARNDVSDLLSAFDVYAMPSLFEGLGISLIEAQTSGLPCVASDAIPPEAVASLGLVALPTSDPSLWAYAIDQIAVGRCAPDRELLARFDLARLDGFMKMLFAVGECG